MTIGQAPQSLLFGSISGSWVAFALFVGLAVVAGVATTAILRRFASRQGEPPSYGTTPLPRWIISFAVGGIVLTSVWLWLWSGFYQLEAGRDSVTLQFHAPSRQRVVPKHDIVVARWDPGPEGTRVLVVAACRPGGTTRSSGA